LDIKINRDRTLGIENHNPIDTVPMGRGRSKLDSSVLVFFLVPFQVAVSCHFCIGFHFDIEFLCIAFIVSVVFVSLVVVPFAERR